MATVTLVNTRADGIRHTVEAKYSPGSGLEISVHDLGPGASLTGDEYECWYRVSAANMAAFCELVNIDPADPIGGLRKHYRGANNSKLLSAMRDSKLVRFSSQW